VSADGALTEALRTNVAAPELSEQDRGMLDFVAQLTIDSTKLESADIDRLRSLGFDDRGILQITLIAAWFNYINRIADALGVGR